MLLFYAIISHEKIYKAEIIKSNNTRAVVHSSKKLENPKLNLKIFPL